MKAKAHPQAQENGAQARPFFFAARPEVVAAPAVSAVPAAPVASDSLAQAREATRCR